MQFSNEEYADIIFVYGFCNGNALESYREYQRRFPNRRQPSRRVFSDSFQRLRQCGIGNRHTGGGNLRYNAAREEEVIDAVLDEPGISTRRIATRLQVSQNFVWRTLHREVLYPYHYQRVHHLQPGDEVQRLAFSRWLLEQHEQDPNFISYILWSDEATFTRDGINNCHNEHVWSLQNPHAFKRHRFQNRFSINTWCGIFNGRLLPIQILPHRLNAAIYLEFLDNNLHQLLENDPLALRNMMWYQHDGAPPHAARGVVEWLDNHFNGRWVGRRGPVQWPARSPDLNPLDFYFWGHIKQLVYAEEIHNEEQLQERIMNAALQIGNEQDFAPIYNSVILRCQACIAAGGGLFEHTL
jgi:hypothetical protein